MVKKQWLQISLFGFLSTFLCMGAFAYNTNHGKIYDKTGNEVFIDGVAWIGFQDSNFLGELYNMGLNNLGDEHGMMDLLKSPWSVPGSSILSPEKGVSFKTIRIPIQAGIWTQVQTVQDRPFDFSHTNINNKEAGNGPFCDWSKGADQGGHCIKAKTAPELLNATIAEFNKQNIRVMLDFHHRPGLGDQFRDGTVVSADYSLKDYYQDIFQFVKTAPTNVLGIDIFNEPHKLYWYKDNPETHQPAWIKVLAAAASAVYKSNSDLLLFIEGAGGTTGNDPDDLVFNQDKIICLSSSTKIDDNKIIALANDPRCSQDGSLQRIAYLGSNWGENFRSLLDSTKAKQGVAHFDVTTFRHELIAAILANHFEGDDEKNANLIADWLLGQNNDGQNAHIVFAPHLYGSEVAYWQSDANDSMIRFQWNFGFLVDSGFPLVIGELGFHSKKGGEDFFNESVAPYLITKKMNHNLFFWTWNHDDDPIGIRSSSSGFELHAWKEQDIHNLFNAVL